MISHIRHAPALHFLTDFATFTTHLFVVYARFFTDKMRFHIIKSIKLRIFLKNIDIIFKNAYNIYEKGGINDVGTIHVEKCFVL